MKEKLTFEAFYPDPPERVWRALTDSSALARWLMPNTFKPVLGFRFRFEGVGRGNAAWVQGEVLELDEAKRLAYTWDDGEDDAPGVVSWTLKPKDGGTHLTLEHQPAEPAKPYVLIEASLNWRYALYSSLPVLMRLLRDEERRPRVPIVYVVEEPQTEHEPKRRAGFRQEEATCKS
jgi:uncharacterized protein YndB with AHSA1/START domain